MARYTSMMTVAFPISQIRQLLIHILEQCELEVIYNSGDYIVARERPGRVSYAKLVVVEVLIDRTLARGNEVKLSLVAKNEELPLQLENHCHEVFIAVNETLRSNREWQFIEQIAG